MKRALFCLLIACAVCSCQVKEEGELAPDGKISTATATVADFVLDGATKTSFTINGNQATFAFEDDDILRIYPLNPTGDGLRFTVKENKGVTCVFDGGSGFGLFEGMSYAAFYPGSDDIVPDATEIPVDYTGQSMTEKGEWDLSAVDYLVASIPAVEGACNFSMKHIGALIALDVTFEEAGTYNELALTSQGNPFITAGTLDLTANPIAVTGTEFAETITLTLGGVDGISFEAGETVRFIMMLAPVDLSDTTILMELKSDTHVISAEIEGKNYQPNKAFKVVDSPVVPEPTNVQAVAIDLGLPSGLKWASCNLGATEPEEYGDYYAWGETEPYYYSMNPFKWKDDKKGYNWTTYRWGDLTNGYPVIFKYCTISSNGPIDKYGSVDNKTIIEPQDDAAHEMLGGRRRMPTDAEWTELRKNCSWTWTMQNGVRGMLVTGPNGNRLFLPAAGHWSDYSYSNSSNSSNIYYSASLYIEEPYNAWTISFSSNGVNQGHPSRNMGFPIRPVSDEGVYVPVEDITLSDSSITLTEGGSAKLNAIVTPSNATQQAVIWLSSNTDVATIDSNGAVTVDFAGSATITATTYDGGFVATCSITVNSSSSSPKAVDLGLPSRLKWATCNLGASKPGDFGDYFAWGETKPYYRFGNARRENCYHWLAGRTGYNWSSYRWCNESNDSYSMTKYCNDSSYGTEDNNTILDPEDDAAHSILGGGWRIPTKAEWEELLNYCTWEFAERSGTTGYAIGRLITGPNGNSIFLPSAGERNEGKLIANGSGEYWSSSLDLENCRRAYYLSFGYSENIARGSRWVGLPIRAVKQ